MKITVIISLLIFNLINIQTSEFELKEFYNAKGIIINDYQKWPFAFANNNFLKKYPVNIKEAIEAEKFIQTNYYEYKKNQLNHFNSNYNIARFENPKNFKKNFKNYNRQYSGFVDQSNDTIIYVGMLNFKNKKKANSYFERWKEILILGSGDWYYANQEYFLYNISKKKLDDTF